MINRDKETLLINMSHQYPPNYDFTMEELAWVPGFIDDIRDYFHVRPEDNLLILRPNRVMHLNSTALTMLKMLMENQSIEEVVEKFEKQKGANRQTILNDLAAFVGDLSSMTAGNYNIYSYKTAEIIPYGTGEIRYPVLSEIAVTYRCNNKCRFCYAYSPYRESGEMSTEEVKRVIDIIVDDAHVPSLSFTGGEPTLREDIFELIAYAKSKNLRVNLITNGRKCADEDYVRKLVDAGLHSAQVSIEGPDAETHDYIVGVSGAFIQTVQGIKNLHSTEIYTHCNTTICRPNAEKLEELVDFHVDELDLSYFSMNMVIYTGTAAKLRDELMITYSEIGDIVRRVKRKANKRQISFVWYAPTPVCIFNPIANGLGAKACACCDGLLSVDAEGNLLPCSSFSEPVGNLLKDGFDKVWNGRAAKFWREKDFAPEGCKNCEHFEYCTGACPLYFDVMSFDEIQPYWKEKGKISGKLDDLRLRLRRKIRGDQHGIT
ncbi:MAG: radical SAM protein [Candidatus Lokiarchaeota archaeon]|nr:radical SAM protein [Candidatus Lokiarchaeota archaeon]